MRGIRQTDMPIYLVLLCRGTRPDCPISYPGSARSWAEPGCRRQAALLMQHQERVTRPFPGESRQGCGCTHAACHTGSLCAQEGARSHVRPTETARRGHRLPEIQRRRIPVARRRLHHVPHRPPGVLSRSIHSRPDRSSAGSSGAVLEPGCRVSEHRPVHRRSAAGATPGPGSTPPRPAQTATTTKLIINRETGLTCLGRRRRIIGDGPGRPIAPWPIAGHRPLDARRGELREEAVAPVVPADLRGHGGLDGADHRLRVGPQRGRGFHRLFADRL